jgi:hypothetical protein
MHTHTHKNVFLRGFVVSELIKWKKMLQQFVMELQEVETF